MTWKHLLAVVAASTVSLTAAQGAEDAPPQASLAGEVGAAADAAAARLRSAPFDSLAWLRADLTGEQVSEFDLQMNHLWGRPFKNYSGDISGRFLEVMALSSRGDPAAHPALKGLLAELPRHQRPGGYFCASGTIDWSQPIDYQQKGLNVRMMPALWGNARMLCGLVEASRAFGDAETLAVAKRLGDFYAGILPRFTDPARMAEYRGGDTYAAGYVTCYFPAMEGLVKLHLLTGEKKYLETAAKMAEFYEPFDRLPIDHAHGMLCNQVALLLLYEATKGTQYLERVERRWKELVEGGYVNPAGGILEKCRVTFDRDEGCALADWLRLNLELGRVTGKARYYAMAERTLHNHYLQNQTPSGGFGHRTLLCDAAGVAGFQARFVEAKWCCDFHGVLGFLELRRRLVARAGPVLTLPLALDFTSTETSGVVTSRIEPAGGKGEVLRQHVRLEKQPAAVLRVRRPPWADGVRAVEAGGQGLPLRADGDYLASVRPVREAVIIFLGGVYAETRRCERRASAPAPGEPFVAGFGPKILAAAEGGDAAVGWPASLEELRAHGWTPLGREDRANASRFVARRRPDS